MCYNAGKGRQNSFTVCDMLLYREISRKHSQDLTATKLWQTVKCPQASKRMTAYFT